MSLPTTFATLTNATGAQLDGNFAALGALTPIACAASGTNTIALAPAANTPTIGAYSNYQPFSFIAAASNTGAVTAAVGTLAALPVYKDTLAGPVALTGGEIVIKNAVYLVYDSALNGGAGGFHMGSQPTNAIYPVVGSTRGLRGSSAGAVVTASWTAKELVAETSIGGVAVKGTNLSLSFNGATVGANGMDTGVVPTSAQLAVYAIYNPTTLTWATLGYSAGTSVASPTYPGANMPAGYSYSTLLWVGMTNGSAQIQMFNQIDYRIYVGPTQVLSQIASVANTYASFSIATVVPQTAVATWGILAATATNFNVQLAVASNSTGAYVEYAIGNQSGTTLDGYATAHAFNDIPILTAQTLYWKSGNTTQTNVILIQGYFI